MKKYFKPLIIFVCIVAGIVTLSPSSAEAISGTFPDGANDPTGKIFSIVTNSGGGVTLNAPQTDLQVFIRASDAVAGRNFTIRVVDACRDPGKDIPNTDLQVDLRARTPTGVGGSVLLYPLLNHGGAPFNGCVGNDIVLGPVSGSFFRLVPAEYGTDYATIVVRINKRNGSGIKAFKLRANGSGPAWATYAELDNGISRNPGQPAQAMNAVWNAVDNNCVGRVSGNCDGSHPPIESSTTFTFSPNCSFDDNNGAGGRAYLKWFDADYGASNEIGNPITYWLVEVNRATGAQTVMDIMSGSVLGGNGEFEEKPYNFKVGYDYKWIWLNFDRINGIQFWMPFSEFNTQVNCKTPTTQRTSPNPQCDRIWGWAIDMDYQQAQLRLQLYADYPRTDSRSVLIRTATANVSPPQAGIPTPNLTVPATVGGMTVSTAPPPNQRLRHGFVMDITGTVPIGGRTFYLYTYGVNSLGTADPNPAAPQSFNVNGNSPSCARPPTGTVTGVCQYSPTNDFIIRFRNVRDADNTSANIKVVSINISGIGSVPAAQLPSDFNGSFDLPYFPAFDGQPHTITAVLQGVLSDGTLDPAVTNRTTITGTSPPCAIQCTSNTTPYPIEPGGSFSITVNISNYTAATVSGPLIIDIQQPGGGSYTGGGFPATVNPFRVAPNPAPAYPDPNSGEYRSGTISSATMTQGLYTINVTYRGTPLPNCGSFIVGFAPYVRAYGGDVSAGSDSPSGNICTGWGADNNGGVYGWGGTSSPYRGAGAQLGVFALGEIRRFGSSVLDLLPPPPTAPNGVAFANTGGMPGAFANKHCPYDYWGQGQPNATTRTVGQFNISGLNGLTGGTLDSYYVNGSLNISPTPVTITGGVCPSSPRTINLYVSGSVTIQNNISYAGGPFGCSAAVPRLQIVARGTINIESNVTQIDGIYVAHNTTPGVGPIPNGTIYTCTQGGTRVLPANLFANCRNQLTVNGALIANRIKWLRIYGSNRDSSAQGEYPGTIISPAQPCENAGVVSSPNICAAEVVNLTPETYLVNQPTRRQLIGTNFDVITALPPLL